MHRSGAEYYLQLNLSRILLNHGVGKSGFIFLPPLIRRSFMNKKVWLGFIATFITLQVLEIVVNSLILGSTYEALKVVWRPDMMSKTWIFSLVLLIGSFFFAFIFSKGYEHKGIIEGVRYGIYIGIWLSVGKAYATYAMIAIPYSLALQWFIYGVLEYVIAGVVLAWIFGMKPKEQAQT